MQGNALEMNDGFGIQDELLLDVSRAFHVLPL
jgi:hypothetical protein